MFYRVIHILALCIIVFCGSYRSAKAAATPHLAIASTAPVVNRPLWTYPLLSSNIARCEVHTGITTQGDREIYIGGASSYYDADTSTYWAALAWNGSTYEPIFASEHFHEGIAGLATGNVSGDSRKEILVLLGNGIVHVYDQDSKIHQHSFSTTATLTPPLYGFEVANLNGSGEDEILVSTETSIAVFSGNTASWSLDGIGGLIVAAQMDNDPGLEIATSAGTIIDGASSQIQWNIKQTFGGGLAADDIDGDSIAEFIGQINSTTIAAYDVERKNQKWTYSRQFGISGVAAGDTDGDGQPEILVGEAQTGDFYGVDQHGTGSERLIVNPGSAVNGCAIADTDGDDIAEIVWTTFEGPFPEDSAFYIANPENGNIEWQQPITKRTPVGPVKGDLDGDGIDEVVIDAGILLIFDSLTMKLRAAEPAGYASSIVLRDVDQNGDQEILTATNLHSEGIINIYDFNSSNTLTKIWQNQTRAPSGDAFHSVEAADIDFDGNLEIIAGTRKTHTGGTNTYLYIYDYMTGAEEWHSSAADYYWNTTSAIAVADLDEKFGLEIVALTSDGVYIINGATKERLVFLPGYYSGGLEIRGKSIYLVNDYGWLVVSQYNGLPWSPLQVERLDDSYVDGFQILSLNPRHFRFASDHAVKVMAEGEINTVTPDYGFEYGSSWVDGITAGAYAITADFLPAPVLSLTSGTDNLGPAVALAWSRIVGDTEYLLEWADNPDFTNSRSTGWIRGRNYEVGFLTFNRTYYFRIKARSTQGLQESNWSRLVTNRTIAPPAAANGWELYE